jgi:hypothetical protein
MVLGKPPGKRCSHQCSEGCDIYPSRPDDCRAFECLWLQGSIDWKPSDTGMVCFAEQQGDLVILKAVGEPHAETVAWLHKQPVPVLLNDIWHFRGEVL